MKVCSRCGESKRINQFGMDRKKPDGKHAWCKVCVCTNQRKWRKLKKMKLSSGTGIKHYDAWWVKEDKDLQPVSGTVAKPVRVKVGTAVQKEGIINLILDSLPLDGKIDLVEKGML